MAAVAPVIIFSRQIGGKEIKEKGQCQLGKSLLLENKYFPKSPAEFSLYLIGENGVS